MIDVELRKQFRNLCQEVLDNDYSWIGSEATEEDKIEYDNLLDDMRHLLWCMRVDEVHNL